MKKRLFNLAPLSFHNVASSPSLTWKPGLCVICNYNSSLHVCSSCEKIGFYNKISHSLIGFPNNIIIHRVYMGQNIPEHLILNIVQTTLILPFQTILWLDDSLIHKHQYDFSNIKNLEIKSISSLLIEFIQDKKYSYLNQYIKTEVKNMIITESTGIYKKIAYAIDCIRLIVLQLYGGLYLDSNIKILTSPKNYLRSSQQIHEPLPAGVKFIGRNRAQVSPEEVCVTLSKLYDIQKHNAYNIKISQAECSAILGNRGAIFFDFCLYDILINYKKFIHSVDNKISNFNKKNAYTKLYNPSPDELRSERTPFIINSMLLAEYLCSIKSDMTSSEFIFKDTLIENEQLEKIKFEIKAYNYVGYITFNLFNCDFIKYYSHSHKKVIDKKVMDC